MVAMMGARRPVHDAAGQGRAVSGVGERQDREINEVGGGRIRVNGGDAVASS
jgi:hypothetical protein